MGCNVRLEDDTTHAEKLDACEQAVKMTLEIVKKDDVDDNRAPLGRVSNNQNGNITWFLP